MFAIDYSLSCIKANEYGGFMYWRYRLDAGDKFEMTMKDELIDVFDYPLPCIDGIKYCPDEDDFKKLVAVVDKWKFNSSFHDAKIQCGDNDDALMNIQKCILDAGIAEVGIDFAEYRCMAMALYDPVNGLYEQRIVFNKTAFEDSRFMDVVEDVDRKSVV